MFGFVTANIVDLSDEEKSRYQAMYCGLCHAIKRAHGQRARFCLSYDLTFLIQLLGSLYEPPEETGAERCPAHPVRSQTVITTKFSPYAADLAVALAYYKCLDDVADEGKASARGASRLLEKPYRAARERLPRQCAAIEEGMAAVNEAERDPAAGPDKAGMLFGALMGEAFVYDADDVWAPSLWRLGAELGRFIYFMDAAVDLDDDIAHDRYNPFKTLEMDAEAMRALLMNFIGRAAQVFETLPLERDLHTMRSVVYAGVWQQFYAKYGGSPQSDRPDRTGSAMPEGAHRADVRIDETPSAKEVE